MHAIRINKNWARVFGFIAILGISFCLLTRAQAWCCEPRADLILNADGSPKHCLAQLLSEFKIEHNGTLDDIVQKTQAAWLRGANQERWDLIDGAISPELEQRVHELLKACGCIDEVRPCSDRYDYVLVMGALASTMRKRLEYALSLWRNGISFNQIVFLAGQRPRMVDKETALDIFGKEIEVEQANLPATESDIIHAIYEHIDLPQNFASKVEVVWVDSPMKQNAAGVLVRPTTADTFQDWLKLNPVPGTALVISNNPYIGYQDSVARSLLPGTFKIETVGSRCSEKTKIAVHLDNLARWLYQEKLRRQK